MLLFNSRIMKKLHQWTNPFRFTFLLLFCFDLLFAQVQLGTDIFGEFPGDESGVAVSLSADGTRLAIGALRNPGTGSSAGHVRIFDFVGGTWTN